MKKNIFIICGPTASGKSKFALNLTNKINGEIINADSMQIYKELKILSARPDASDLKKAKHHLYGYVEGKNRYNVEKWCKDATKEINLLSKKNKTPILVGGTGLYIDTLINGISPIPSIPEYMKKESSKLFEKFGNEKFYEYVKKIDEHSVKLISKNDIQRLKRIWEVFEYTNKKFSSWKKNNNKKFINSYNFKIILFLPERKENYKRVNKRTISMIEKGALNEIKNLLELNYNKNLPIMRAHGVPEISSYFAKKISLDECISKIQLVTRHYVKRQNTWWRSSKLQILHKFYEFADEIDVKSANFD